MTPQENALFDEIINADVQFTLTADQLRLLQLVLLDAMIDKRDYSVLQLERIRAMYEAKFGNVFGPRYTELTRRAEEQPK